MNTKKIMFFGFIIIILCALALIAMANPAIGFTVNTPTNGSTVYPEVGGTLNFSISTNESFNQSCQMLWNNNGTLITMSNMTAVNASWQLAFEIPAVSRTSINNVTFKCGNTTALKEWMNTSSSAGFLFFTPKNADYSIVDMAIVNNSVLASNASLNITVGSDNATNCTYNIDNAGEQTGLMSQSPNRMFWTNSSAVPHAENAFDVWNNITYNCTDSAGNYSSSGLILYKLDISNPTFPATPSFTLGNKSTGGNYLNVTFNISDKNPGGCMVSLFWDTGEIVNITGETSYNSSIENTVCYANVTSDDIDYDGYAYVVPASKDNAGNYGKETNQSYIFYRLSTGWNLITGYENKTLSAIAAEFTNVTYVSVWDNIKKVFWTHTVGGATNASIGANFSSNQSAGAAYVYVTEDVVSMRRHYGVPTTWENVTMFHNTSSNLTTWNMVGITKKLTDLNATIQKDVCDNSTYNTVNESIVLFKNLLNATANSKIVAITAISNTTLSLGLGNVTMYNSTHINATLGTGIANGTYNVSYKWAPQYSYINCSNITWVSFYSTLDQKYCSFYRGRLSTGCSLPSNRYNLTRGDVLWIAVSAGVNLTLNRNGW